MSRAWENPCRSFPFEEIQKATNNFHESKVIGIGGFGKVYKGLIGDGSTSTVVAVKRLNPQSNQGVAEFETEIKILSRSRHCHVVCLVGYCNEQSEMILVYEYMSNGTLGDHLYKNENSSLTWEQRIKICIGAARGLDYLHSGTGLEDIVIHLDVKSANILLDDNFAAKIADLGLSKTGPANQPYSEVITDHIQGTRGYIDPQYRKSHMFSRKADVYAFGVVFLEVLSGTRAIGGSIIPDSELADRANWIKQHIRNGTLNQIADERVVRQIEPNCLQIFANTTFKSLHEDPKKRPTMSEVVAQLESALAFQMDTIPSSSMIEDHIFQHFNAVSIDSSLKATSEHVSYNNEESSDRRGVVGEPRSEDLIDSDDSAIWSSMGVSIEEHLGYQTNLYGKPITDKTMVQMRLNPTRKNKAQIAYRLMNEGNKYDNALRFLKKDGLGRRRWTIACCLLYNATGETLTYVASRSRRIFEPSYPRIILNGQWGAYRQKETRGINRFTGFSSIVVYRGKSSENYYVIAWSSPWQYITQDCTAYCEINEVGHFDDAVWETIYRKLRSAGRESSAEWKDSYTKVTIEGIYFKLIFKAIITRVDAINTLV